MAESASIKTFLLHTTRVGLGALFIYAGFLKALDPAQLLTDIEGYRLVPYTLGVAVSLYLPYLEIFAGLAIVFKRLYLGGLVLVGSLMGVFTLALASAWYRGLNISCGCFGKALPIADYRVYILRDILLVMVPLLLAVVHIRSLASKA
jgi:hypothetical protein